MICGKEEYAEKWNNSANHLFDEGVYEWSSEPLNKYNKVLEIGCGTGQSTFVLVAMDHTVFSIDRNSLCIEKCKKYIESNNFSVEEITCSDSISYRDLDVTLLNLDLFSEKARLLNYLNPDVIILWNPGGWDANQINYADAEKIQWRMIDTVIEFAESKNIPFSILNRFAKPNNTQEFWQDVAKSTSYKMVKRDEKKVDMLGVEGVPLITSEGKIDTIIYSYALFEKGD